MKRYMNYPFSNAIWCGVGTVSLYFYFIYLMVKYQDPAAGLILAVPTAFLIVTIALASVTYERNNRGRIALTGKKAIGLVSRKTVQTDYRSRHKNYLIDFTYESENKETLEATVYVSYSDFQFFVEGKEIPIYVKGEYAMFNMVEVRRNFEKTPDYVMDYNVNKKEPMTSKVNYDAHKVKFVNCPYCDSKITEDTMVCPHCGATHLLD